VFSHESLGHVWHLEFRVLRTDTAEQVKKAGDRAGPPGLLAVGEAVSLVPRRAKISSHV